MNQSKTFYLVRHGIATYSTRGYGKRKLTAPILPEAVPIMRKLAHSLNDVGDSINKSSEIIRCRETSAIITEVTGKVFTYDKRLNEDNNETVGDIRGRVGSFLDEIIQTPHPNIIICTHGIVIAAIKNLLVNNTFLKRNFLDYSPPGTLVIIKDKEVTTVNFN